MRKHKILLTVISVIVLLGIIITASAIAGGKKPDTQGGKTENLIADRISFTLQNTEFTVTKSTEEPETFTLTMYLEAKKTQGDFYGIIDSFTLSDITYDSIIFTDLTGSAEAKIPSALILTATDGEPDLFRWQVDVNVTLTEKGTQTATAKLQYTSGTAESSAMTKTAEVPITITVK